MGEEKIGMVTHYFGKIGVAALKVTGGELRLGDTIHLKGRTSDFTMKVESMQVEHRAVELAKVGDQVGLKVPAPARVNDEVFKVTEG